MERFLAQVAAFRHLSIWRFARATVAVLGIQWLLIEVISFLWPSIIEAFRAQRLAVLLVAVLIGFARSIPRTMVSARIKGTDVAVTVRVGDLFSERGALIVGSNTTFDTSVEDRTISPRSVQGQLMQRLCTSREQLDRDLEAALRDAPCQERAPADKPYGKCLSYAVGTVARVQCKDGRNAYLVAIATLNKTRAAQGTRQDVLDALPKLWEHVRSHGEVEPVATSVLGSGFSRVQATRQELVKEMVRSFVAANHAGKFCEELTIVLASRDFMNGQYDLLELGRFLAYECEYSALSVGAGTEQRVGTPIGS